MNHSVLKSACLSTPADAARTLDESIHAQLAKASMGLSPISLALSYADWAMHLAVSPGRQALLAQKAADISRSLASEWFKGVSPQAISPASTAVELDPRFTDPNWNQWPFNGMKQGFKASEAWWRDAVQIDGMSSHNQHVMEFFTQQGLDALAPSNWGLTNPQSLATAQKTMGQSWLKGLQHFAEDALSQQALSKHAPTNRVKPLPFKVGKDVAVTPGKVVFRNHLIELIQYTPTTSKVYPEPILIVPSCIMKYYILDLSPANSMVRYLVEQGHTVFMISWRNPDASDRALGMQDYLQSGVMAAMAAVKEQAQAPRIHALGYCLGGTFLAIVASALGACQVKPQTRAASSEHAPSWHRRLDDQSCLENMPELATVTLLAGQTDFSEPGELGIFIDADQLKTLRESMARTGYLTGSQMAGSFQFLNARDLIFTRNTRRYLLGEDEVGNDMMSWNADVTRLPERMHDEYLSSLFLSNALASGHYRVAGQGVALKDIKAPMLVVGTLRDHVSPWQSVYKIHLLTDTHITFILAAGGHNAGIISEPGHPRRSYQKGHAEPGHGWIEPEDWLRQAPLFEGSWWPAMHDWLAQRSGAMVPAPQFKSEHVLADAPGDYIMVRYAD